MQGLIAAQTAEVLGQLPASWELVAASPFRLCIGRAQQDNVFGTGVMLAEACHMFFTHHITMGRLQMACMARTTACC